MSDLPPVPKTEFEAWIVRKVTTLETDVGWIKQTLKQQNTNTYLLLGLLVTVALDVIKGLL